MRNSTISVQPMSAHTGAEISGVDLSKPLSDQTYLEIREALNDWGAIFFRDQDITPAQQLAFGRRFGTVEADSYASNMPSVEGLREVKEIVRNPGDIRNARELPSSGGDTMFAHLGAAFDTLSPGLQATLETLSTIHIKSHAYGVDGKPNKGISQEYYQQMVEKFAGIEAVHPAVGRHPETGRKVLFVSPFYSDRFVGWTREESLTLIRYLASQVTRPENTCRFRWREGSVAMWDNRAVMHYALDDYPGQRRVMHRITVDGPWLEPCSSV
jgi:taurine dioxygenase